MAEYAKKLHVKKGSTVTDIKLYSTTGEVGSNYVTLKDGSNLMYAKLGATSDALASPLNVKKGSTTYKVLTNAVPPYAKVTYTTPGTFTFTVPVGVTKLRVEVAGGGGPGGENNDVVLKGGNGALIKQTLVVLGGSVYSLTVGGGGGARTNKPGDPSSFGGLINAQGGKAANWTHGTSYSDIGNGGVGHKSGSPGWVYVEYGQGIE